MEHAITPGHGAPAGAVAHAAHETSTGLDHRKIAMWAFLGSDCIFFGSFIMTYLIYRGRSLVGPCPHECVINGVQYHGVFNIPYTSVSAFVLLMSSVTMVLALAAIQRGDHRGLRIWLLATALLGSVFVGGQYFEFTTFWNHGLHLDTNTFGTTFYVLTGFHGAHVTVGIIMLLSLLVTSLLGRLPASDALTVELTGLYWHFVDIVWIVIFTVVYLLPM